MKPGQENTIALLPWLIYFKGVDEMKNEKNPNINDPNKGNISECNTENSDIVDKMPH